MILSSDQTDSGCGSAVKEKERVGTSHGLNSSAETDGSNSISRQRLGLVRYHVGDEHASHESYMREIGVWDQCHYPGFSSDPMNGFEELAHDLNFAGDFVTGSGADSTKSRGKRGG